MKLTRYNGHVPLFSQDMEGRERTLFGSTVQDDDINNQFTPEFLRGWGSVGSTEFPTLQDFNALAYTHNKLLSYLYQAGIPSYTQNEEYYIGSIVQYNKDIYICLKDKPTVLPTDTNAWKRVQESLTFVGDGPEVMKRGAYGVGGAQLGVAESDYIGTLGGYGNYTTMRSFRGNEVGFELRHFYTKNEYELRRYRALDGGWQSPVLILHNGNTRTDKNKVLHAGTSTPINTLNVSDMSQEVINNDLLTVTSGAVYRALQQKQESLTFVGSGDVVRKWGAINEYSLRDSGEYIGLTGNFGEIKSGRNGLGNTSALREVFPSFPGTDGFYHFQIKSSYLNDSSNLLAFFHGYNRPELILGVKRDDKGSFSFSTLYGTYNTRTDANNVLHAGTSTPINTLNVSDMSQEVIDNDLLTVTSGAVYRALGKKITGGNVVQTTGQSTTDVMSQKAVTDRISLSSDSYKDVKSQRVLNTLYTNNTDKPLYICVVVNGIKALVEIHDENVVVGFGHSPSESSTTASASATILPRHKYIVKSSNAAKIRDWSET